MQGAICEVRCDIIDLFVELCACRRVDVLEDVSHILGLYVTTEVGGLSEAHLKETDNHPAHPASGPLDTFSLAAICMLTFEGKVENTIRTGDACTPEPAAIFSLV